MGVLARRRHQLVPALTRRDATLLQGRAALSNSTLPAYGAPPPHADKAIIMGRELEAYDIYWLEEPVLPDDFSGYFRVADALTTRVVGGESHFTRFDLKPFFEHRKCPILQPDVIRGGLTDLRKTAAIADTFGLQMAPHLYPELMIHLMASIPNGLIIEDMGLLDDIWVSWPRPEKGVMRAPETPGHGLVIKPEIMRDARVN